MSEVILTYFKRFISKYITTKVSGYLTCETAKVFVAGKWNKRH
jgi:outer membrane protease